MAKMEPVPVDTVLSAGKVTLRTDGVITLSWLLPESSIDPNLDAPPQQRIEIELGKAVITDLEPPTQ